MPQLLSAHVLTACYGLCNRLSLTGEELALLDEQGQALTPAFWRETKAMLELADRADGPTSLELGGDALVHLWLGVPDEGALVARYGMTTTDALALDAGELSQLAASLEQEPGAPRPVLHPALSHAWTARADRLMEGLPDTAELVLQSLERAVNGLAFDPPLLHSVGRAILEVAQQVGDEARIRSAHKLLGLLAQTADPSANTAVELVVAGQILTVLYALMHDALVLDSERRLEPEIASFDWKHVALALREGRFPDVPVPVRLLPVWGAPEDLPDEAVQECLRRCRTAIPHLLDELERLWGGAPVSQAPGDVAPRDGDRRRHPS